MEESDAFAGTKIGAWALVGAFAAAAVFCVAASVLAQRLRRRARTVFFACAAAAGAARAAFYGALTGADSARSGPTAAPDAALMHTALVVPEACFFAAAAALLWATLRSARGDAGDTGGDPAALSLYYGRYRRAESIRRMRSSLLGGAAPSPHASQPQASWRNSRFVRRSARLLPFVLGAAALVAQTVAAGLACAAASTSPDAWRAAAPIVRGFAAWAFLAFALVSAATHRFAAGRLVGAALFVVPKGVLGALDFLYLWTQDASPRLAWLVWTFLLLSELLPLVAASVTLFVFDVRLLRMRREAVQPLLTNSSSFGSAVQW